MWPITASMAMGLVTTAEAPAEMKAVTSLSIALPVQPSISPR